MLSPEQKGDTENVVGRRARTRTDETVTCYLASSLIGVTSGIKALNATQKLLFLLRLCQILRIRMVGSQTGKKLLGEKLSNQSKGVGSSLLDHLCISARYD